MSRFPKKWPPGCEPKPPQPEERFICQVCKTPVSVQAGQAGMLAKRHDLFPTRGRCQGSGQPVAVIREPWARKKLVNYDPKNVELKFGGGVTVPWDGSTPTLGSTTYTLHLHGDDSKAPWMCLAKQARIIAINLVGKTHYEMIHVQHELPILLQYGDSLQLSTTGDLTMNRDMFTKPVYLAYTCSQASISIENIQP